MKVCDLQSMIDAAETDGCDLIIADANNLDVKYEIVSMITDISLRVNFNPGLEGPPKAESAVSTLYLRRCDGT